jgi:hypothetical protein
MNLTSKIFDSIEGRDVYEKRTICEVLKQIYDLAYLGLAKSNPEVMESLIPLLEEAYIAGVKMTKKLVEYKVSMPEWEANLNGDEISRIRTLRAQLNKKLARCEDLKLALIIKPNDYKFGGHSYSKTYKDMLSALYGRFGNVKFIGKSQSAKDIDADVIFFFDTHSNHHITIDGIENHPAIKYEYFNDLHQKESLGVYPNRQRFHKLGAKQRTERALSRGIDYIVTPSVWGYNKYIAPHLGSEAEDRMVWFPPVPKKPKVINRPLKDRPYNVTCQGHMWSGRDGFRPYEFRRWAAQQKKVMYVPHFVEDKRMPIRESYIAGLTWFRAAIAACEYYPVAKYFEIPLAGCVLFAQRCEDFERLGFRHGENCVVVNKTNLNKVVDHFLANYEDYQRIADAGKKHVEENWTAECFAEHIYNHAKERL